MSKKTILLSVMACLAWGPLGSVGKAHAEAKTKPLVSITHTQVDRDFIHLMEGSSLKGYVPLPKTTQSGVTIAHGFDLGQPSLAEFNNLPISESLKKKLRPYVGLRKQAAVNFLKKHPLTITEAELQQLNLVAANKILQPLMKYYQQASGHSFLNLPAAAQTVLFSYAYQNGPAFMKQTRYQKLWHFFVNKNWYLASQELRQFKQYKLRRMSEAKLLEQLLA